MKTASYAVTEKNSKGRVHEEQSPIDRNEFERDRSRILHSKAWRRLQYKTQVFANYKGDSFRTRATHSLEVAQLSKSIARSLCLNEDLAETLAIAHDLGHAPFGHVGQDVLEQLMEEHGGFEHNLQALRIVDHLEKCYIDFDGLNLMFETRAGLLKHCSKKDAQQLGEIASRHLSGESPPLEAQIVNWCDAVAYNHADLEDGYSMGNITMEQLITLPFFSEHYEKISQNKNIKNVHEEVIVSSVLRSMFSSFAANIITISQKNIVDSKIVTLDDVRKSPELISMDSDTKNNHYQIKRFLREHLYGCPEIQAERDVQILMLKSIFSKLIKQPILMDEYYDSGNPDVYRQVCDYIAGMTDRFAISKCKTLQHNKSIANKKSPKL